MRDKKAIEDEIYAIKTELLTCKDIDHIVALWERRSQLWVELGRVPNLRRPTKRGYKKAR